MEIVVDVLGYILEIENGWPELVVGGEVVFDDGKATETVNSNVVADGDFGQSGQSHDVSDSGTSDEMTLVGHHIVTFLLRHLQMVQNDLQSFHELGQGVEMVTVDVEFLTELEQGIFRVGDQGVHHSHRQRLVVQSPASQQHSSGTAVQTGDGHLATGVARLLNPRALDSRDSTVASVIGTGVAGD